MFVGSFITMEGLCASAAASVLGSFLMAAQYVGVLYIFASGAGGRAPNRDDPRVIKERFVRVGVASIIAPIIAVLTVAIVPGGGGASPSCVSDAPMTRWFGLWAPDRVVAAVFLPLLLTVILFTGPLVMAWVERDRYTPWGEQLRELARDCTEPKAVRNLLVGPLTEEWVFRACMCPLLYGAGFSDAANVFLSGGLFGLVHIHHVFDARSSLAVVGVQFTYTSLFGAYSSYLFLRTGLLYGPVLAHAFCNSQGLPRFGDVPNHPRARLLSGAFVFGLGSFIALVTLDAIYRPALFHSMMWEEHQ